MNIQGRYGCPTPAITEKIIKLNVSHGLSLTEKAETLSKWGAVLMAEVARQNAATEVVEPETEPA